MAESQLLIQTIKDAVVINFRHGSILDSLIIDAIARELYALADERAARKIVLDFGGVKFLASQAVGVLITLKRKADAIGGQVVICNMPEEIRRVFKIMKLDGIFRFHGSEAAALESMGIHTA